MMQTIHGGSTFMGGGVLIGPYLSVPKGTTLFSQRNSLDRGRRYYDVVKAKPRSRQGGVHGGN